MITISNVMPQKAFEIEGIVKGYCDVVFYENVREIKKEDEIMYEYDFYRMKLPYKKELYSIIEENYCTWLQKAKDIEKDINENPHIDDYERYFLYKKALENDETIGDLRDNVGKIKNDNRDITAITFNLEYILSEISSTLKNFGFENIIEGSEIISKYQHAKKYILGGIYDKEILLKQLVRYKEKGLIATTEYDELIELLEGKENANG